MSPTGGAGAAQEGGLPALRRKWLDERRAEADRPPLRPRLPLLWQSRPIGSVEAALFDALERRGAPGAPLPWRLGERSASVQVEGPLSAGLARIAQALRDAGLAHVWRDELLPVTDSDGTEIGSVERAVVRLLGIATRAVHLVGLAPDGRHWVQQRSLTKANDPGLWDTLMGGMVPAGESLAQALARETWEEAGLEIGQLQALGPGGRLSLRRPADAAGGSGYVVEAIDWYRCVVPQGRLPVNQDGEVAQFRLMDAVALERCLLHGDFTLEAGLILAEAMGWAGAQPPG